MSSRMSKSECNFALLKLMDDVNELRNKQHVLKLKLMRDNYVQKLNQLNSISDILLSTIQKIVECKNQIANEGESAFVVVSDNVQLSSTISVTNHEEFRQLMAKFLHLTNQIEEMIKIIDDNPKEDVFTNMAKDQLIKSSTTYKRMEKMMRNVYDYQEVLQEILSETTKDNILQSTMNNTDSWEDLGVKPFANESEDMSPIIKDA